MKLSIILILVSNLLLAEAATPNCNDERKTYAGDGCLLSKKSILLLQAIANNKEIYEKFKDLTEFTELKEVSVGEPFLTSADYQSGRSATLAFVLKVKPVWIGGEEDALSRQSSLF